MDNILEKAEHYVTDLLSKELETIFVYHNLAHTKRVVDKSIELGELSNLSAKDKTQLTLAAWFHDTGFLKTVIGHEEESIKIARNFLEDHNFDEKDIEIISELIRATKLDRAPKNELECLIKDADCAHVSSKNYEIYAALLKKEWESTTQKRYTDKEWLQNNIDFINKHKYYSNTANLHWSTVKSKNLSSLLKKQ